MARAEKLDLSMADIRQVACFSAACAEDVHLLFERDRPDDPRPRAAIDAAWVFGRGEPRTKLQRTASLAAHAAAREATSAAGHAAARAAGHAAAAAYLHPLAQPTQVKHILGAAAHAAAALELAAGGDPSVGAAHIDAIRSRVAAHVARVVQRYPAVSPAGNRVAQLMFRLDQALRAS